jgi:hypothetical protein
MELQKGFNYFKIKFGDYKKFSTFAVPNKTGVRQRMLAGRKKTRLKRRNNRREAVD